MQAENGVAAGAGCHLQRGFLVESVGNVYVAVECKGDFAFADGYEVVGDERRYHRFGAGAQREQHCAVFKRRHEILGSQRLRLVATARCRIYFNTTFRPPARAFCCGSNPLPPESFGGDEWELRKSSSKVQVVEVGKDEASRA